VKSPHFRINKILVSWYLENKRDLPWRRAKNPYQVWLSEIILQQTQVVQGLPYYEKFITRFPSVEKLAQASEQEVLKLWQGLGYYSRARNLHDTAQWVSHALNGVFPQSFKELLSLKGVGVYTASAIASICFDEPKAVVDGNVYRVLSRVFGIDLPINTASGIKRFQELADQQLFEKDPGTYNQAIMEFGALQCVPKNPDCSICPLSKNCIAHATGHVGTLPVSVKKVKVKTVYYNFLVVQDEQGKIWMRPRPADGIWPNLYEFPLIESNTPLDVGQMLAKANGLIKGEAHTIQDSIQDSIQDLELVHPAPWVHRLTHKKLMVVFWRGVSKNALPEVYAPKEVFELPVPAVIARFISEAFPFARQN
jgi:A/G-specific adenine glycosylase